MTSRTIFAFLTLAVATGPAAAQSDPELPYWASISVDEARMRKGPSPDVPVVWEYRRKDLPVKVVARHDIWRKIEDPDGTQGWMAARLLSRTRTAIVTGGIRPRKARRRRGDRLSRRGRCGRPHHRLQGRLVLVQREGPQGLDRNRPHMGRLITRNA